MRSKTRLPETISITDLARQMERQGRFRPAPSEATVVGRRALLAMHSLAVKTPARSAVSVEAGQDVDGWMLLRCNEIDCYDRNPRVKTNPRYAEIRASIQARGGLGDALSVTRRPQSERYMCYMGGNTRLQIVQELWRETKDPAYEWIRVVVHPWVSESDVIAAHLIENELRADTTFWEKARGVAFLKSELEADLGAPLSLRALSEHAHRCGLKLHAVTATNYLFAVEHLDAFGPHLTHESAGAIRCRFGHLEKLADALNLDPYVRVTEFQQLAAAAASEINGVRDQDDPPRLTAAEVEKILLQMNGQLARLANCSVHGVEQILLAMMGADKPLSPAEIRERLAGAVTGREAGLTPVIPDLSDSGGTTPDPEQADFESRPAGARCGRPGRAQADCEVGGRDDFGEALMGFAASFQLAAFVRRENGQAHRFSVEALSDSAPTMGERDRRAREAAHRLLMSLTGRPDGGDADAQSDVSLLLQPAHWSLLRTLMDAYHRQFREDARA